MKDDEKKLSEFIDRLNEEKKPDDVHTENKELEELYSTVRLLRGLKEPEMPPSDFGEKLVKSLSGSKKRKSKRRNVFTGLVGLAAACLLVFAVLIPLTRTSIVSAMEKAFSEVQAYHGSIEVQSTNEEGVTNTQAKMEVWADQKGRYYVKGIEGFNSGVVTVNNGDKKWQLNTVSQQIHLLPAFPDTYPFTFELGNEINDITTALSTEVIGEDMIAGRSATILEVTPKGGEPYKVWIDNEMNLPLKKQTAWQNALQYTVQYSEIEMVDAIPADVLSFVTPDGYEVIQTNPEKIVSDLQEAEAIAGFIPSLPNVESTGFSLEHIAVSLEDSSVKSYYRANDNEMIVLRQKKANGPLNPDYKAITGTINGQQAEIQQSLQENSGLLVNGESKAIHSVRWQEDSYEFSIVGNTPYKDIESFAKGLTGGSIEMPESDKIADTAPEIDVPYDLGVVENTQKSVDAGNSPWNLDPVFVAQVFASLQLSPEGIVGDYPIAYEELKVLNQTNSDAIVEVNNDKSSISKIYLKRLVRQDNTGIWTVVGYDLKKK
ncbi:sigma-E factor regulatory protein RseB domain-containing protein [Sporosarcina sp. FSL W8-0480]|uniref:LolA family protein n=1 Tax=Sporosarcina sp. FSL W8-0480 TaxID=2954701 RepID=UPI0030DAFEAF